MPVFTPKTSCRKAVSPNHIWMAGNPTGNQVRGQRRCCWEGESYQCHYSSYQVETTWLFLMGCSGYLDLWNPGNTLNMRKGKSNSLLSPCSLFHIQRHVADSGQSNKRILFLKRWEYQTTLPASQETCMQVKKQQLEQDMEQQPGSKLEKGYVKAVYCHPAYLTFMQSTSYKMPGWMKLKLESRLPGEIPITSDMQMTPRYWQKANRN